MKRTIPILMLIALLGVTFVMPNAWADDHGGRHDSGWNHDRHDSGWNHDGHDWHGDRDGHWEFGWHDGRLDWLWVVGGAVLLYNVTHPTPVSQPPTVIVQTPAQVPTQAYWYFCPSSGSYYPYVKACPDGWQRVAAPPPPPNQ